MRILDDLEKAGLRRHFAHLFWGVVVIVATPLVLGQIISFAAVYFFEIGDHFGYFIGSAIGYVIIQFAVLVLIYQMMLEWREVFQKDIDQARDDPSVSGPFWAVGYVLCLIILYPLSIHSTILFFEYNDAFNNSENPSLYGIAIFAIDHAARGVLFDLMESFKFEITKLDYNGGFNFISISVFLFRTSISFSLLSTLLFSFRWYKSRTDKKLSAQAAMAGTPSEG